MISRPTGRWIASAAAWLLHPALLASVASAVARRHHEPFAATAQTGAAARWRRMHEDVAASSIAALVAEVRRYKSSSDTARADWEGARIPLLWLGHHEADQATCPLPEPFATRVARLLVAGDAPLLGEASQGIVALLAWGNPDELSVVRDLAAHASPGLVFATEITFFEDAGVHPDPALVLVSTRLVALAALDDRALLERIVASAGEREVGVAHRAHKILARLRDALEVGVVPRACAATACQVSPELRALRAALAPSAGGPPRHAPLSADQE